MKKYIIHITLLVFTVLVACNKDNSSHNEKLLVAKDRVMITLSKEQAEYIKTGNKYSLTLFKDLYNHYSGKSFVFSPLSTEYVLTMLANGAEGQTLDELMALLQFSPEDIVSLNNYYKLLYSKLPTLDNTVSFATADAIIYNTDCVSLKEPFVASLSNYYDALIKGFSFSSNNIDALVFTNTWVKEKTNDVIKSILETVDSSVCAYLLNTMFFKGNWNSSISFNPNDTKAGKFTRNDGNKVDVDYMHLESDLACLFSTYLAGISLPYGNGAFCMDIYLPVDNHSLDEVVSLLSNEGLPNNFTTQKVVLSLPKFTIETKNDLKDGILSKYIPASFSPNNANFSNISNSRLFVGQFFQKAKIDVNEVGTESAAVTVAEMVLGGLQNNNIKRSFNANKPFMYCIHETSTNAILILGVFNG